MRGKGADVDTLPDRAHFEPFVVRDAQGRAQFANRLIPVRLALLWPGRRRRGRKLTWPGRSLHARRIVAAIEQAARIAGARRWLPCNPMVAHLMHVEDVRVSRARLWATSASRD